MTAMTMSNLLRGLAVVSVMSLAACQVPPKRANTDSAGSTAAARPATSQPTSQQPAATNSAPAIAFHLAQTKQAQGLARVQLNQNTSLYAVPQPVLTQADLQQIVPIQNKNGQVFLRFDFTQQGTAKLAQLTRQSVGNYLIISANGKLVSVPRIAAAYTDGKFPVPVKNAEEARAMLQVLRQPAK